MESSWNIFLLAPLCMGVFVVLGAVYGIFWATQKGQMQKLDQEATIVFDPEEPEGVHSDFFPGEEERAIRLLKKTAKN